MTTTTDQSSREQAPPNNLPDWSECAMRVSNSEHFAKQVAQGGYGPDADSKLANELHRFIYEYDDADPYRSAWFLHRLELVLNEAKAALSTPTAITAEEAGREGEAALTDRQISAGGRELCNRAAEACEVDREDYWKTYGNEYIEDFRAAYLAAMKPPSAPAQSGGQRNG